MGRDWDYSQATHMMKELGGPAAALETIRKGAYQNGSADAWSAARIAIVGAGAACLLIGGAAMKYGPGAYETVKRQLALLKQPKITAEERAEAEKQIIEAIEKNPAPDDDDEGTDPNDDAGTGTTGTHDGTGPDTGNGSKEPTGK